MLRSFSVIMAIIGLIICLGLLSKSKLETFDNGKFVLNKTTQHLTKVTPVKSIVITEGR